MSTVKVDTLETLDGSLSADLAELINRMGTVGGTAASKDAQVSPSDSVAGRLLAVGAFGLGSAAIPMGTTSLDNLITSGCQFVWVSTVNVATCNAPSGASGGVCLHVSLSSTSAKQTYFQTVTADRTWTRYYQSGVWAPWVEVWTSANLEKTSSNTDTTAGRMIKVGDFAIGGTSAPTINAQDLNTLAANGLYYCTSPTNGPIAGTLLVRVESVYNSLGLERGSQWAVLVASSNNDVYYRQRFAGSWSAWVKLSTNPMTDSGDITYGGTGGAPTKLPKGSDTQVLTLEGGVPAWKDNNSITTQTVEISSGVLNLSAVSSGTVLVSLTENITSITLPAGVAGKRKELVIQFQQDGVGGRTVSGWPASSVLAWQGGVAPVISSKALAITHISMSNADNTLWIGYNQSGGGMEAARVPATQRIIAGAVNATALTTIAATAARIQYIPFIPSRRMKITSLGFSVSTLLSGTATMGIYAADGSPTYDYPGTRLAVTAQGALSTLTVGTKTAVCDYVLEPGVLYFIAVICSAACTLRGVPLAGQSSILGWTDNSTTCITSYYSAGTSNILPETAGAPIVNAGVINPALYLIEG